MIVWLPVAKLFRSLSSPLTRRALRYRVAPSYELRGLLPRIAPEYIVDIGANRGQFSLLCAVMFPDTPITAFEPVPQAAAVYRQVLASIDSAELRLCALGAEGGTTEMVVTRNDDNSSLLRPTDAQVRLTAGALSARTEEVILSTLDEEVFSVEAEGLLSQSLVKVDVQGGELGVLRGGRKTLSVVGHLLIEVSFDELYGGQALAGDIVAEVHGYGLALDGLRVSASRNGRAVQADMLFRRESVAQ